MQNRTISVSLDEDVYFKVDLYCSKSGSNVRKELVFHKDESPPFMVYDIKLQVERSFNIPLCVQDLSYETYSHGSGTTLNSIGVRNGDVFHITYLSEADCEEISEIIEWLYLMNDVLKVENLSVSSRHNQELDGLITLGIHREYIENLAFKYFFPWLDTKKYANKLYFVSHQGVDYIMELYAALLEQPWDNQQIKLKYLEYGILRVLWNLSETFALRRLITAHNGLQMSINSLLRKKITEGEHIMDTDKDSNDHSWVLTENIGAALGTLCNLSELSECHVEISSNYEALDQLTCISLSPSVRIMSAQLVATLFLCVAYTPQTHQSLANPMYITRLLKSCNEERKFNSNEDESEDTLMLRYFTQVFLAQVILVSPQHIPSDLFTTILKFMESFLTKATYEAVMKGEVKHWYVWSTFLPYVKLAYVPVTQENTNDTNMSRLHLLSVQTIIFSLQNMLGRDNHRQVLVKENLLDYVTCMPLYVPGCLKAQAKELVNSIRASPDIQVQPPKLVSLVKAKLAKMYFGLDRIIAMSVGEIISEVLPF